jgi:hypothetical protein
MNKTFVILGFFLAFAVVSVLPCNVGTAAYGDPHSLRINQAVYHYVKESEGCPFGYQCYYNTWMPHVDINQPIWVFGISNNDGCGGMLNFREYPDRYCEESCSEYIPVLYTAEVMYIPPWETPVYSPGDVLVTFIPPGKYVVTSPSVTMHYNIKLWYFPDKEGSLSAFLESDSPEYEKGEDVTLSLSTYDQETGAPVEVDTITGKVILPDQTVESLTPDSWCWDESEKKYTYILPPQNKEGGYAVSVTVQKAHYRNATASTTFMVCFDLTFEITCDKNPPIYTEGEPVLITVTVTDGDQTPVSGTLLSELLLPDNSSLQLEWEESSPGVYTTTYYPPYDGTYVVVVWLQNDNTCYLGKASSAFTVVKEGEFECMLSQEETEYLAKKYAPHLYFYKGFWGEEKFFPTKVEVMLENSTLWEFDTEKSTKIPQYDKTAEFISDYATPDYYLDLNDESCTIDPALADKQGNLNLYYRVICHRYEGKMYIVIQYRPFYIFNDFYNNHEGDWEMIEILLDYYSCKPIGAAYSRHLDGEYRLWDDIEKKGTHPVVYMALGSHAAYFEEGIYYILGPFFDIASDNGQNGLPSDYCLISEISGPPWLYFGGNWGYRVRKGKDDCSYVWNSGPRGPLYCRETWLDPVGWAFSHYNDKSERLHSPYTLFSLSCPANMLITNSTGQRLGFVDGEFVQEIPNSYVQNLDEKEAYIITGIDQFTVEVFGTGEGTFDLACSVNVWDNTKTIKYTDVPVTPTTKAVLDLGFNLLLNVDVNQDGITDFTISPVSIQLLSSQSINPLQRGEEMIYEVVLINQGNSSTFTLDVDTPLNWSYSLSSNAVTLSPGQSATILLFVTSPQEIPLEDYTIRFEATSLKDSQMTANLELIASSKSELVAEDMTANCKDEDVILTAFISNMGLLGAENVKIQFFNGLPSRNNLLGEQIIDVTSGESVAPSIRCALPDGLYTLHVVIDPDNSICESCEFNNELSIKYLLDRTPPEAEIFFDPGIGELAVRGIDNLDSSVDVSVTEKTIKNKNTRTYMLTDDAGNTTELQLEINFNRHEIKAEIIDIKYNGHSVALPQNSFRIEYIIKNGNIKMLSQYLIIGEIKVHLIYNQNKDQTKVITNGIQQLEEGLVLVIVRTNRGNLQHSIKNIRWIA